MTDLRKEIFKVLFPKGYEVVYPETEREQGYPKISAILDTISKHLPEKKATEDSRTLARTDGFYTWAEGYNRALTDINKLLTTNKKEEV